MLIPPTGLSMPMITDVTDCADFSKTVLPYLNQLYAFYTSENAKPIDLTDVDAWKHLYTATNPVVTALVFSIATWPIFFLVSEINKNYSQVDRVWSILPTIYNVHYAIWARLNGMPTRRVDNVMAFSMLWSLRLTFNYWRRGGYQVGSEDYRWQIIKKYIGGPAFFLLNVVFISTLQILILFAVSTPTYILLLTSRLDPALTYMDIFFSRALIALIVVEYFADQQQWNYHQAKASYQSTAKIPSGWTRAQMDRGFNTSGLWRFSRHPNFAAEQTIWVILYAWGCYESRTYVNWTFSGVVCYLLVFQGSTPITEWVTGSKYPEYKFYQQRVGRFLPALGKGWDEAEMKDLAPKLLEEDKKKEGAKKGKMK